MGTQKQFGIVEIIKVIDRISGAEPDSFDLLKIDVVDLLILRGAAAKFEPLEGILQSIPETSVKTKTAWRNCLPV